MLALSKARNWSTVWSLLIMQAETTFEPRMHNSYLFLDATKIQVVYLLFDGWEGNIARVCCIFTCLRVLSPGSSEYIILIKLNLPQPVAIKNSYNTIAVPIRILLLGEKFLHTMTLVHCCHWRPVDNIYIYIYMYLHQEGHLPEVVSSHLKCTMAS